MDFGVSKMDFCRDMVGKLWVWSILFVSGPCVKISAEPCASLILPERTLNPKPHLSLEPFLKGSIQQ